MFDFHIFMPNKSLSLSHKSTLQLAVGVWMVYIAYIWNRAIYCKLGISSLAYVLDQLGKKAHKLYRFLLLR